MLSEDHKLLISLAVREWWVRWISYEEPSQEIEQALRQLERRIEQLAEEMQKSVDFLEK